MKRLLLLVFIALLLPLGSRAAQPRSLHLKITNAAGESVPNLRLTLVQDALVQGEWSTPPAAQLLLLTLPELPHPEQAATLRLEAPGYEPLEYLVLPSQSGSTHLILSRSSKPIPLLVPVSNSPSTPNA